MKRRRFLGVAAGFAAFPAFAATPVRWQGIALGAEARLELSAPPEIARPALAAALDEIERVEREFSLYRADSTLVRLNQQGGLNGASALFDGLLDHVAWTHDVTDGLFDPTVQPVWHARANGDALAEDAIGWHRVQRPAPGTVQLGAGQALTFNGIAQGFATDRMVAVLRAHGLSDAFVDLGEQSAIGRARRLAVVDPDHGRLGAVTLTDGAIATSSPGATTVTAQGHIVDPRNPHSRPRWSTVSVEAETAVMADGLSTALVHADMPAVRAIARLPGVRRILLSDPSGNVRSL